MAWIEVHQALAGHHKTIRLAKALGIKRPQAVGHLVLLWLWALDNAPSGDLSRIPHEVIAEAAMWTRAPDVFLDALSGAAFLDADGMLHDWWEYAGRLIDKRRRDADRKRTARGHPADGAGTQPTSTSTVPNQPDQPAPAPDQPTADAGRPPVPRVDYRAVENLTGHLNKPVIDAIDEFRGEHPLVTEEWVVAACEEAALNNGRSWRYVSAILKRWERDGFKADTRPRNVEPNGAVPTTISDTDKAMRIEAELKAQGLR